MAKKKQRSLLTQQREKLKAQKAAKALRKTAEGSKQKALPPKGGSSAGSTKARVQRGLRRDALAKQQLENFGRAMKKTLKQGAAQDKLNKAAKGTKGSGVRTGQAAPGKLAKRPSSAITKSSSGKTTTSAKSGKPGPYYGKGPRGMRPRLPAGKPGGALATRGSIGSGGAGTAAAQTAGLYLAGKLAETIGKPGQSKMSKLGIKGKKTASSKPKMKPSPGMSKGAVAAAKKGAAAANASKPPVKASKPSKGVSTPKPKSKPPVAASKPQSGGSKPKSTSSTYKKHGSDLHVGRYKTLKEHRAAVERRKKGISKANQKGYPGNRNY